MIIVPILMEAWLFIMNGILWTLTMDIAVQTVNITTMLHQKDGVVLLILQHVNILATCLMEVNFMDIVRLMECKLHLVMFKTQPAHLPMKWITTTHQEMIVIWMSAA